MTLPHTIGRILATGGLATALTFAPAQGQTDYLHDAVQPPAQTHPDPFYRLVIELLEEYGTRTEDPSGKVTHEHRGFVTAPMEAVRRGVILQYVQGPEGRYIICEHEVDTNKSAIQIIGLGGARGSGSIRVVPATAPPSLADEYSCIIEGIKSLVNR